MKNKTLPANKNNTRKALSESEAKYRNLVERANDGIIIIQDGILKYVNPRMAELDGSTVERLIGSPITDHIYPDDMVKVTEMYNRRMTGESVPSTYEALLKRADGRSVPSELNVGVITHEGRPAALVVIRDITERKQAEDKLHEQNVILNTIKGIHEEAVRSETLEHFGQSCLNLVESITGSKFSFIGEIGPDGLMHDIALSDPGWELCTMYDKTGHRRPPGDFNLRGFFGYVLREGKSLVANEPDSHPESIGTPEGHPKLTAFLGVPFIKEGRAVGMIGVGNREGGYTEREREILEALIPTILGSLLRKRAEEDLQNYKNLLEEKVRERTAELTKTNKSLLKEIAERKATEKKLQTARNKLRAMATEILVTDERARQHFATDLHDSVVQTMGAAKLRAQLIQDMIPQEAKTKYSEIQDMLSQSITQARSIMAEISPPVLHELGFVPALEWLTEQMGRQHNLSISFKTEGIPHLSQQLQILLFQATREILMNVVKHSGAAHVAVKVTAKGPKFKIAVEDDGKGFNVKRTLSADFKGGGYGLFSIGERLSHFDGELSIRSKPGQGTKVTITVPNIEKAS